MQEKKHKNILFTFDYELFLGEKSGSADVCLIYPTKKIMEVLKPAKLKGIFFIDTTYLLRLSKECSPDAKNDFYNIAEQIKTLIKEGHYIFPHLHPHWVDAVYNSGTNEWSLKDITKYRFHTVSDSERKELFEQSVNILKSIVTEADPSYELNGYRAGGWSIQPFSDFKPYFEKYGIKYDFSVLLGSKFNSDAQQYDFTNAPRRPIYRFSDDIVKENMNGDLFEFTISGIQLSAFRRFLNRLFLKLNTFSTTRIGNGISVKNLSGDFNKLSHYEMLSIELLTFIKYPLYLNFVDKNEFVQFISHPKMTTLHGFSQFQKFINEFLSTYAVETDFKKMIG